MRTFVALVLIAMLGVAATSSLHARQSPDDDRIWTEFVTWLKTAPATTEVGSVLEQYAKHLAGRGATPEAVGQTMNRVLTLMRDRPDAWQPIFDRLYTTPGATFKTTPTPLLVSAVDGLKPGRALDVGMGQGRNAVFLALKGWDVTGIDLADAGLSVAREQAQRGGVSLRAVRADAHDFDYGTAQWDLVVITYGPGFVGDAPFAERLLRSLKPGARLVVESFASDRSSRGRKPVDLDPRELLTLYGTMRIVRFEDVDAVSEWDPQVTRLVRLVAQKRP